MSSTRKRSRSPSLSRIFTAASIAAMTSSAFAQEPAGSIDALRQLLEHQQHEIDALKERIQAMTPAAPASAAPGTPPATTASWGDDKRADRVSLSDTPDGYRLIDTASTSLGIYGLIDLTIASSSSAARMPTRAATQEARRAPATA